jgi:TonB family protein
MSNGRWHRGARLFCICASVTVAAMISAGSTAASNMSAHVDSSFPNAQPPYPDSARAGGEQGTVLVAVYVRPTGRVGKYRVVQSSGFADLDDAAVERVLGWRFVPATRDGDAVSDWTTVRIVFQLPPAEVTPPPRASN